MLVIMKLGFVLLLQSAKAYLKPFYVYIHNEPAKLHFKTSLRMDVIKIFFI